MTIVLRCGKCVVLFRVINYFRKSKSNTPIILLFILHSLHSTDRDTDTVETWTRIQDTTILRK